MLETPAEIDELQALLDRSHAGATEHLKGIIHGERLLTAADIVGLLSGMKVVSLATVTAAGEPRISAVDGHFLHGTWTWSTSGSSAKARHLATRPSVSAAHVDNEELAVFSHGKARQLGADDATWNETIDHWTAHYDESPLDWGPDIRIYRLEATWMVGYAADRQRLRSERGLVAP